MEIHCVLNPASIPFFPISSGFQLDISNINECYISTGLVIKKGIKDYDVNFPRVHNVRMNF